MERSKLSIYLLSIGALASLVVLISRLLGAFGEKQEKVITTNDIKVEKTLLPQACKDSMNIMSCILSSDKLSGSQDTMNESYQQLLSEWNTITDQSLLTEKCSSYYTYLLSLQETWYQQIIDSCQE